MALKGKNTRGNFRPPVKMGQNDLCGAEQVSEGLDLLP